MIGATDDGAHFGQKRGQRSHRRRFPGSPVAKSQDAADRRIHGCDQEGQFHLFLSDNRREGKRPPHMSEPYFGLVEGWNRCFSTSTTSVGIVGFSDCPICRTCRLDHVNSSCQKARLWTAAGLRCQFAAGEVYRTALPCIGRRGAGAREHDRGDDVYARGSLSALASKAPSPTQARSRNLNNMFLIIGIYIHLFFAGLKLRQWRCVRTAASGWHF